MHHEPDWNSLTEINFLIYRRMADHLNAALAAVALIGESGKPEGFWQDRATSQVMNALDLHNAWSSLIRHKAGETFLRQHQSQFHAVDLLKWLTVELQLLHTPTIDEDMVLVGNRESLQEAVLLLHSCAYTLGPGVNMTAQHKDGGIWFRVMYDKVQPTPETLDTLLETLHGNWRVQNTAFELRRARDFLRMNNCELVYKEWPNHCELAFFIPALKTPTQRQNQSTTETNVNLSTCKLDAEALKAPARPTNIIETPLLADEPTPPAHELPPPVEPRRRDIVITPLLWDEDVAVNLPMSSVIINTPLLIDTDEQTQISTPNRVFVRSEELQPLLPRTRDTGTKPKLP